MHLFVGSQNPVKLNAVRGAAEHWPKATVVGYDAPSGVSDQPMSDAETKQGAVARAHNALKLGLAEFPELSKRAASSAGARDTENEDHLIALGVGLEGGAFQQTDGTIWSTVWVAVVDQDGEAHAANGGRFQFPAEVAQRLLAGEELGLIASAISGEADIKHKQGFIGIITNGLVSRTEEYQHIARLALGLWWGKQRE